ncbi:hypothetical protein IAI13_36630, partial [Escherichia coli]|nr:hypothetical protein [Escherichia coli]
MNRRIDDCESFRHIACDVKPQRAPPAFRQHTEIAACLRSHPAVADAAVVAETGNGPTRL